MPFTSISEYLQMCKYLHQTNGSSSVSVSELDHTNTFKRKMKHCFVSTFDVLLLITSDPFHQNETLNTVQLHLNSKLVVCVGSDMSRTLIFTIDVYDVHLIVGNELISCAFL